MLSSGKINQGGNDMAGLKLAKGWRRWLLIGFIIILLILVACAVFAKDKAPASADTSTGVTVAGDGSYVVGLSNGVTITAYPIYVTAETSACR